MKNVIKNIETFQEDSWNVKQQNLVYLLITDGPL